MLTPSPLFPPPRAQGMDVVQGIEKVKCDKDDKPLMDIKIISIVTMHTN